MLLAVPARATDLTDAVDAYNTAAAGLQDLYDDFIADQNAAYQTFQEMYDALGLHILADNLEEAEDYWDDHVAARQQLQLDCAVLDHSFFSSFVPAASQAALMLQGIIDLDSQSSGEVAYVSGSPHFSLPATPFLFWKDEGEPPMDEFVAFDFPQLAVGDPAFHTSYEDEMLGAEVISWLSILEWIRLFPWLGKHKDTGQNLNNARADEWDMLCYWCLCILELEPPPLPDGVTEGMAYEFCETYGDTDVWGSASLGYCVDNMTTNQKAIEVRTHFEERKQEDIDNGPAQAIEDYVQIAWYWDFAWEVE